jgi:hypothetical protein
MIILVVMSEGQNAGSQDMRTPGPQNLPDGSDDNPTTYMAQGWSGCTSNGASKGERSAEAGSGCGPVWQASAQCVAAEAQHGLPAENQEVGKQTVRTSNTSLGLREQPKPSHRHCAIAHHPVKSHLTNAHIHMMRHQECTNVRVAHT